MVCERMRQAKAKGAERIDALLCHGGDDPLSIDEVADLLNLSVPSVHKLRDERLILGVSIPASECVFPAWQFDRDRRCVIRGIPEILSALDASDIWSAVIFFASPNINTEGIPPIDILRNQDADTGAWDNVMRAAKLWRNHGAS